MLTIHVWPRYIKDFLLTHFGCNSPSERSEVLRREASQAFSQRYEFIGSMIQNLALKL